MKGVAGFGRHPPSNDIFAVIGMFYLRKFHNMCGLIIFLLIVFQNYYLGISAASHCYTFWQASPGRVKSDLPNRMSSEFRIKYVVQGMNAELHRFLSC